MGTNRSLPCSVLPHYLQHQNDPNQVTEVEEPSLALLLHLVLHCHSDPLSPQHLWQLLEWSGRVTRILLDNSQTVRWVNVDMDHHGVGYSNQQQYERHR